MGSNVRIDAFCILSGEIQLSNYIHISAYATLYGRNAGIIMEDYSGLSVKCSVYAVTDDFSGVYAGILCRLIKEREKI